MPLDPAVEAHLRVVAKARFSLLIDREKNP